METGSVDFRTCLQSFVQDLKSLRTLCLSILISAFRLFRIVLVPLFFLVLISDNQNAYLLSLIIFTVASITDFFDGKLARKYDAVSKFGLFLDPLADKVLVLSAFFGFLYLDVLLDVVEPWMVFLIFFRDILVTCLRIIMKKNGLLMVTSKLAKLKTTSQLVSIIIILSLLAYSSLYPLDGYFPLIRFIMIIVTLFSIYTGFDYYYRNIKLILSNK